MNSKRIYDTIVKSEPVNKGWSGDKKYCVETSDGQRLLLRMSKAEKKDRKKTEYDMMTRAYNHGVLTSRPIEFGLCDDGKSVYQLSEWLNGEDVETVLPLMTETEQFILGLKAGETLRKIHTLSAPKEHEGGEMWFDVIDGQIKEYRECGVKFEGDDYVIGYIEKYRYKMERRVKCFRHSDYHVGNMMVVDGKLHIIDFGLCDYGDPWEDLSGIVLGATYSPHFATGKLRGYFGSNPTQECFTQITFYIACNMLSSICWAAPVGQVEIDYYLIANSRILAWFENMQNPVPNWYLWDFYVQWVDGIPYKLKEPYDFSFLSKYGKVFKVFDEQGINVCFGVKNGAHRYFVKFAGAKPINFDVCNGNTALAIEWLKNAVPVYRDLEHPALIKFIRTEEIGGGSVGCDESCPPMQPGYAAVFKWVDAIGIEPLNSPDHKRFMKMPIEKKIQAFEDIMSFHSHVAAKGYVAIDFYDGSILYNYENEKVIICDIDFYQKSPYVGEMGLWGSSRFVSPEECTPGAVMDEITMVYTMGATAVMLFGYDAETDIKWREQGVEFYRTQKFQDNPPKSWQLSTALYNVVRRAVYSDRDKRQQSIEQLIKEWRASK